MCSCPVFRSSLIALLLVSCAVYGWLLTLQISEANPHTLSTHAAAHALTDTGDAGLVDADTVDAAPANYEDDIAGGHHWRFETPKGPVHVWRPEGYDPLTAGIVVYVHGFYTNVDQAWHGHKLAEQFAASERNALFVVPEAPVGGRDPINWNSLGYLIRTVRYKTQLKRPLGPTIAIGHSGAYKTLLQWRSYAPLSHIVLLDALYGRDEEFATWLDNRRKRRVQRLTIVANDTVQWAEPFVATRSDAHILDRIPARISDMSNAARAAQLLYVRSQYAHMEMVTNGRVIPLLVQLTGLRPLQSEQ